jgi:hypothetical protein
VGEGAKAKSEMGRVKSEMGRVKEAEQITEPHLVAEEGRGVKLLVESGKKKQQWLRALSHILPP